MCTQTYLGFAGCGCQLRYRFLPCRHGPASPECKGVQKARHPSRSRICYLHAWVERRKARTAERALRHAGAFLFPRPSAAAVVSSATLTAEEAAALREQEQKQQHNALPAWYFAAMEQAVLRSKQREEEEEEGLFSTTEGFERPAASFPPSPGHRGGDALEDLLAPRPSQPGHWWD